MSFFCLCLVHSYSQALQILLSSIMVSNPQERPNISWVLDQVQDLQSHSPNTQTNMVWPRTGHLTIWDLCTYEWTCLRAWKYLLTNLSVKAQVHVFTMCRDWQQCELLDWIILLPRCVAVDFFSICIVLTDIAFPFFFFLALRFFKLSGS